MKKNKTKNKHTYQIQLTHQIRYDTWGKRCNSNNIDIDSPHNHVL